MGRMANGCPLSELTGETESLLDIKLMRKFGIFSWKTNGDCLRVLTTRGDSVKISKGRLYDIELCSKTIPDCRESLRGNGNTTFDMHSRSWEAPTNSDFMQGVIRTAETVPETECLAQLAEEACELAQAALKLRRAMGTGNPTPVSAEDSIANLEEEIADAQLCTAVLVYADGKINADNINKVMNQKAERWLERLKERDNNG